jgi:L-lactate dehydrogenase
LAKVAIVGLGDVGATLAYTLQLSGLAREIVLVDIDRKRAEGEALDLNHGLFFTPPVRLYAGEYEDCEGASVVVVAAGARQKSGETRLQLVQRNGRICKSIAKEVGAYAGNAIFLVTTNPVDVMTYVVLKTCGLQPNRVIGSGTVLDSARFRYALSEKCGVDARNVHAYVVGEQGDSEVRLWSSVNISGVPLESFCEGCERGCSPQSKG